MVSRVVSRGVKGDAVCVIVKGVEDGCRGCQGWVSRVSRVGVEGGVEGVEGGCRGVVSWAVEGAIEASTVSTLVITHNRHCTTSFSPFNCNITPYMCSTSSFDVITRLER